MFSPGLVPLICVLAPLVSAQTGKRLVVTTVLSEPYVFERPGDGGGIQGLVVDVFHHAAQQAGFKSDIRPRKDLAYGHLLPDGTWTGMIGEIVRREADVAAGDITITHPRSRIVDFTYPYRSTRLAILMKKPKVKEPSIVQGKEMAILQCLDIEVWIMIIFSCFLVAVLMTIIAVVSPCEKAGSDGGIPERARVSFPNSLLFVFSTITWQGYHVTPRSASGRTLAVFWWVFALLFLVTFTASLTSRILAVDFAPRLESPINSFDDLTTQTRIAYGVIQNGSTDVYFRNSQNAVNKRIHESMAAYGGYVASVAEGVDRVARSNGDYAFIMEGSTAEYITQRRCDLMYVGETGPRKGYGFACHNASLCKQLSLAILTMAEDETLDILRHKWFTVKGGACATWSPAGPASSGHWWFDKPVGMMFAFIFLAVGIVVSLLILGAEVLCARRKPTSGQSMDKEAM